MVRKNITAKFCGWEFENEIKVVSINPNGLFIQVPDGGGGYRAFAVIQMKDLTVENRVDCSGLVRVEMEKLKDHHLVKPGDLFFRSRGQVTSSTILTDDPGKAVVAAPLLRIRVTSDFVMPEYLNWFISQEPAQAFLAAVRKEPR
ncbi:hypothetical protein L7E55_10700 [Pelotomaculum isophthalicicum JI]|uniref:Uncharacterized protein n=1 Tax=Pelotomaculum isophthalicicum JI TaxID=947010 RepID=A0A9X4JW98_9FIRM|nr:hypothetical protein [Pelotomaculum isophthalicicum]MDF9408817.1 hypothetical protein [Pelotomaculum isophthalicicum JI]